MAYTQQLRVRFDDVDYAQIVYFPRFFEYCHWVFEDFFSRETEASYADLLTRRRVGFPTVQAEASFKAPLRFGQDCRVVMETLKLGRSSLANRYRIYRDEGNQLCAEVRLVHVATHLDTFTSMEIAADIRAAFSRHLVGSTSG
jgi:4-hydroxybenzoyl-CoA thioesterase